MLALAAEAVREAGLSDSVTLVQSAYSDMRSVLEELEIKAVHGIILDLGLSSDQLAWEDRGFSFNSDGPLDMRFDANEAVRTAAELVNQLREAELADLIFEFGEERFSRRIAQDRRRADQGTDPHDRPACRNREAGDPRALQGRTDQPGHSRLPGAADRRE